MPIAASVRGYEGLDGSISLPFNYFLREYIDYEDYEAHRM
jgi:hypothetical protein